jgi:hypothetical protein
MESPVDVKGRKWQATDDSVIKKVRKMKKIQKKLLPLQELNNQPTMKRIVLT